MNKKLTVGSLVTAAVALGFMGLTASTPATAGQGPADSSWLIAGPVDDSKQQAVKVAQQLDALNAATADDPVAARKDIAAKAAEVAEQSKEQGAGATDAPVSCDSGINDTVEAPISRMTFESTNSWAGIVAGQCVGVYVGVSASDSTQGAVYVLIASDDSAPGKQVVLGGAGRLRIARASGQVLTIVDSHGREHRFDVGREDFLK